MSAVIVTCDRGDRLVGTIESILANDHASFELIVVDQSPLDDTQAAVERYLDDPRVRYVRSERTGAGRARNTGIEGAHGDVVAFADDDVQVPPDWLTTMEAAIAARPRVAVAFCRVVAAPHDRSAGFVPTYEPSGTREITTVVGKCRARGIGAGMAVRAELVTAIGGFDPELGPGSRFRACEDWDLAVRALLAGHHVLETDAVTVVHDGFRTWAEGRELTRRDWYGIGALLAKPIRARRFSVLLVVFWEGVVKAVLEPIWTALVARRRPGLLRAAMFWRGFTDGIRQPVDARTLSFRTDGPVP